MTHHDPAASAARAGDSTRQGRPGVAPAGARETVVIGGFPLALDRRYDPATHLWAKPVGPGRLRIGMDALGVETSGTLAELSLPPAGTKLVAGRPFGQLEAAKFVGPLVSPVSGTVWAVNAEAAADPGLVERDPYGAGWLIEAVPGDAGAEPDGLLEPPDEISRWFAAEVERYRLKGVIAE